MKKLFCLLLPFLLLFLCSCGGSMKGWPKLELNLDVESYDAASLEYRHIARSSSRNPSDSDKEFYGTSSDKELIAQLYQQIDGSLYSKKTYKKIDTENYRDKVVVTFYRGGETAYTFTFYGYGVKNGYFVFDNGEIHKHNGAFVGITYARFADKMTPAA